MAEVIQYTPREMLAAMKEQVRPDDFLARLETYPEIVSDNKYIEIDDEVVAQGIAGYNNRTGEAIEVAKDGHSTYLHVAPYVDEQITFTPADADTRAPGETIYEGSAISRYDRQVMGALNKLGDRFDRLDEKQRAEVIQAGTITVLNSDVGQDYTIDYQLPAANKVTLTGTAVWGGAASAIKTNLQTWAKVIRDNGYPAVDLIMQGDAADLLLTDATTSTGSLYGLLDTERVFAGEIDIDTINAQRASYLGRLKLPGVTVRLWAYYGGYRTDSTTFVEYLTQYRAVMIGSGFGLQPCFGKIENRKSNFVGRRFPNMWSDLRGKRDYVGMESSPLKVARNIRGIFSAIVKS